MLRARLPPNVAEEYPKDIELSRNRYPSGSVILVISAMETIAALAHIPPRDILRQGHQPKHSDAV
jgi:hypothetical protein